MSEKLEMDPIMVLPTGQVSQEDIALLRANGLCVVEAKDPSTVRFHEPPINYDNQKAAAIALSRLLLRDGLACPSCKHSIRQTFTKLFVDILLRADPLKQHEIAPVEPLKKGKP